ncbi:MAG TPA: hypothetical protein VIW73_01870 [Candidatus Cybelea sp.]
MLAQTPASGASGCTGASPANWIEVGDMALDQRFTSLNRFLDVLFALAFFRAVQFLPAFQDQRWLHQPGAIFGLLEGEPTNLTRVVFGLIVVAYFWCRKNTLLSMVERSNAAFEALSIAAVAFVFLFLYALEADPTYIGGPPTLLLQSLSLLVASLFGFAALRYAIAAGLAPRASRSAAEQIARVDLSNPLTAAVAAALAWSGLTVWTLSWFVLMPLFSALLARTGRNAGKSHA